MPIFPTLVLWAKRIAKTKRAHIRALTCQGLLVPLNVLTIICLSLSLLFTLFLVPAQWLPLTVRPTQPAPRRPAPVALFLYLLTLTKLKRFSLGWARATWKLQWSLHAGPLPGTSPAASCSIVLSAAVLVNSRHWRLLPSQFYGPPPRRPSRAPPGRLSQAVSCLMLFCKLLSPGSLLITVQGLRKPTQRRRGEGERTGTLAGLKRLRRWSIQIPNEIITTN